jgi:glycosyltransferase involved in cell wall biosynthesis
MKHNDVLLWLDHIDIYAQPSKQEGLPRALIEAMSRSCPSIGSTTAGIPELLGSEVIFGNGEVNEICNILRELDNDKMVKLAEINYNKSKEFDSKIIEERRQNIFRDYLEYVSGNIQS